MYDKNRLLVQLFAKNSKYCPNNICTLYWLRFFLNNLFRLYISYKVYHLVNLQFMIYID